MSSECDPEQVVIVTVRRERQPGSKSHWKWYKSEKGETIIHNKARIIEHMKKKSCRNARHHPL